MCERCNDLEKKLMTAIEILRASENPCASCAYGIDGLPCFCSECDVIDLHGEEACNEDCIWWGNVCGWCMHGGEYAATDDKWQFVGYGVKKLD